MTSNELNNNVSLHTKLIALFTVIFQILSFEVNEYYAKPAIITTISLLSVLLVDCYFQFKGTYKYLWSTIKWIILGIIALLIYYYNIILFV